MQFKTSELSGMMLDFACAKFDSHCEGTVWELRGDHYVGLNRNDLSEPLEVVTIICDPSDLKRKVDLCLQYKLQMQLVYSPSTNWAWGGAIIESEKIRLDGGDNQWSVPSWKWVAWPKSGNGYGDESPLVAAMRAFVASKVGDTIEIGGAV